MKVIIEEFGVLRGDGRDMTTLIFYQESAESFPL
jgi:hypothetical protein